MVWYTLCRSTSRPDSQYLPMDSPKLWKKFRWIFYCMYHHWSLGNICIIIRYMKKSLVTEALTSSEVHFDTSGEMASDLEAFAEGLGFPLDFDPYHKPSQAFRKIWAWNCLFPMADSEALAANLVLQWCHCPAWSPAWLWVSFCSCLRWLSSPIFGTTFHDQTLHMVKCESILI